ncbi:MAG TPA: hypothetical protein VJM33_05690 [Microthrixaceae bacterium]|nr:hypothetical protein [Microthrixaceae bacterium]
MIIVLHLASGCGVDSTPRIERGFNGSTAEAVADKLSSLAGGCDPHVQLDAKSSDRWIDTVSCTIQIDGDEVSVTADIYEDASAIGEGVKDRQALTDEVASRAEDLGVDIGSLGPRYFVECGDFTVGAETESAATALGSLLDCSPL